MRPLNEQRRMSKISLANNQKTLFRRRERRTNVVTRRLHQQPRSSQTSSRVNANPSFYFPASDLSRRVDLFSTTKLPCGRQPPPAELPVPAKQSSPSLAHPTGVCKVAQKLVAAPTNCRSAREEPLERQSGCLSHPRSVEKPLHDGLAVVIRRLHQQSVVSVMAIVRQLSSAFGC